MVFLILTRAGFDEIKSEFGRVPSILWVNQGVLSDEDIAELRSAGVEVTGLGRLVNPDEISEVDAAVDMVQRRYAGSRIWVERAAPSAPISRRPHGADNDRMTDWKRMLQAFVVRADQVFDHAWMGLRKASPFATRLMVLPYRGYATSDKLVLTGRVLRDEGFAASEKPGTPWQNLFELYKRLSSNEVPGARVRARFRGMEQVAVTDREGYFGIDMALDRPIDVPGWNSVELELIDAPLPMRSQPLPATAEVLAVLATARFGVISDIDDTVVWTNVANKLKMLLMLSRSSAHTRKPFKGVAAFYQALRKGASGDEGNPIFYVSSSPWNLYTPLVDFMQMQGIPKGPVFLKDFGDHTLFASRDHHTHKLASIEQILQSFPDLQFILIGDSGEQDPEIYSRVVEMYPGRVRVIYIRNMNPDPSRIEAIDKLIDDVRGSGAQLVLAPDSEFAATHAAAEGLISSSAVDRVRQDKREDEKGPEQAGPGGKDM